MADLKIEVFTSPRCPHCPSAVKATKQLLKENKKFGGRVKWAELNTATPKGRKKAQSYGIRGVPTIVFTNKKGERGAVTGTPSQKKYLKIVYEMLGEEMPEEVIVEDDNAGFFDRLFKRK